ncbi:NAD+ synthase [Spirochaetia bacterium]|nr:NAD+ synthase [Spirochaetia bacterium]GHU32297.1 NAD+ synthase [Spirochaetia bacterium]
MRIAIAQINSTIGDFSANREKILTYSRKAKESGADIVLFPELVVCGYPPMDLLDQDHFTEMNVQSVRLLQQTLPEEIAVGIGFVNRSPYADGKSLVNEYAVLFNRGVVFQQIKTLLPTYDVFDEARNFEAAREWNVFEYRGKRIAFAICEDVWRETDIPGTTYQRDPVKELLNRGLDLLCVPSASPFVANKQQIRRKLAARIARRGNIPLVYINAVGANDSIIFDGRSFVMQPDQNSALECAVCKEDFAIWDSEVVLKNSLPEEPQPDPVETDSWVMLEEMRRMLPSLQPSLMTSATLLSRAEVQHASPEFDVIEAALVMGIRDYMAKCNFTRAHLGLSGGIDSALVAYLGVQAVGPENIICFSMPSRFSSRGSKDDAAELAKNLGCRYETLSIEPVFSSFLSTLDPVFQDRPFDIAEENLQARIRGTLLMAFSNKFNSMLLTTGNKSELAMGYCTLYGDMNGALSPIGDLFKTEVFALCRKINSSARVIPEAILTKPPSAELRPDQRDQDSLPPYEILDEILRLYLFENLSKQAICDYGFEPELISRIISTVARAEFKRRQAPPVLKVSQRAFGMGRRMPIARNVYEL